MELAEQEETDSPKRPVNNGLHIGYALAWARKHRGMTRTEVAEKIGCHKSWMSRLENAEHSPSFESVVKFSKLFKMHIEQIRLGVLPVRLRNARATGSMRGLEKRCDRIPGGLEQLQLAEQGVRLPSDAILLFIRRFLEIDDVMELLYGSVT